MHVKVYFANDYFSIQNNMSGTIVLQRRCFLCSVSMILETLRTLLVLKPDYSEKTRLIPSVAMPLKWRHNERDSVSNHQPHEWLLNRLFRRRSKKTSKLRVTGLCAGNSPGTGDFPAQISSSTENVSIWWRHHAIFSHAICYMELMI